MLRGTHDDWEKLVGAVLDREELRRIAYCESLSSSVSEDSSSCFSFNSASPAALDKPLEFFFETVDSTPASSHNGARPIKFKELLKATKSFHHDMWLGRGAFGHDFKGWIDEHTLRASNIESGMAVVVKKWNKGSIQHEEYLKEIYYLSQYRHPNLVKLIGYCSEGDNLILVHEFMSRGSLDNLLFRGGHQPLSWAIRMKVALGAAKALSFLHDLETPVVHRGCKCVNILLDDEFNAKLSGFSLARYGATGRMTQVSTGIPGSRVLIAAEYGQLTEKSDVYSFGSILWELLSGMQYLVMMWPIENIEDQLEIAERYVGDESNLFKIIDTRLGGQYPHHEAYTIAKLACQCLRKAPEKRPRMADIVHALQQFGHP